MSTPEVRDEAWIIASLYDSYIKAVLKNRSRSLKRQYYKHVNCNRLMEEMQDRTAQSVEVENKNVIAIREFRCEVSDDDMYQALITLPEKLLLTIIQWYWYAEKTQAIARYFRVSSRTILNWHDRAITLLRESLREVESFHET